MKRCEICTPLDGKRWKVNGAEAANKEHPMFPMHPNCRCAIIPVADNNDYDNWLDALDAGYTTKEWNYINSGTDDEEKRKIVKSVVKRVTGVRGHINIPPLQTDTDSMLFDSEHVASRGRIISVEDAKEFIKNSIISITRWNGMSENYYSEKGAAYVNTSDNKIATAFRSDEYDSKVSAMIKVVRVWTRIQ